MGLWEGQTWGVSGHSGRGSRTLRTRDDVGPLDGPGLCPHINVLTPAGPRTKTQHHGWSHPFASTVQLTETPESISPPRMRPGGNTASHHTGCPEEPSAPGGLSGKPLSLQRGRGAQTDAGPAQGRTASQRGPGVQAPARPSLPAPRPLSFDSPHKKKQNKKKPLCFHKTAGGNLLCREERFWVRTEICQKACNEMSRRFAIL